MNKFQIIKSIENLSFLKKLIQLIGPVKLYGKFEIEPYKEFSIAFQANYWFIKYTLLANDIFELDEESSGLMDEKNINLVWVNVTNETDFIIECKDGDWSITFLSDNDLIKDFFKEQKFI
jgi:hypothetical protein